jgi:hypothetical protein
MGTEKKDTNFKKIIIVQRKTCATFQIHRNEKTNAFICLIIILGGI